MIQDQSDYGAKSTLMSPLWLRFYQFLWCTMIWLILVCLSSSSASQRNTPLGAKLHVISSCILLIGKITLFIAIEKLIQARGETSPVLTSFDPIHSPTSKEPPDQTLQHVPSYSPIHSSTNSATSTPSSSTKRSSRRRTMLFSSSVWSVSSVFSTYKFSYWSLYPLSGLSWKNLFCNCAYKVFVEEDLRGWIKNAIFSCFAQMTAFSNFLRVAQLT